MVTGESGLRVRGARVRFGDLIAVDGVDLTVRPGEITALVGPSGCGKSSLLRFVAGLTPGRGTVAWDGVELTGVRPDRRRFGLMFQDHALFTDRDVAANIAFGLKMAGMGRRDRQPRIAEVLALVGLEGYEARAIDTLSGGEAQRIALARALAPSPRMLMLDEPLGSLDRILRERLADDLREILTGAGIAAVLVTHDQEEAYAVADHLAVMRAGRIVRDGPAAAVWADPADLFTARFLGHRNILGPDELRALGIDPAAVGAPTTAAEPTDGRAGGATHVVVPEAALRIVGADELDSTDPAGPGDRTVRIAAVVTAVRFRGPVSRVDLEIATAGGRIALRTHPPRPPAVGETVGLVVDPAMLRPLTDGDRTGQ